MRIIVIHPGALGDLLLALPALAAIRTTWPDSEIVGYSRFPVWNYAGLNIVWRDLERSGIHRLFSEPAPDVTGKADVVISWMGHSDHVFIENMLISTGAPVISAPSRPPEGGNIHVSKYLLGTLKSLKISTDITPVRLQAGIEGDRDAEALLRNLELADIDKLLVIHPGAGARKKCWPAAQFAEIALKWRAGGNLVIALEGPADGEIVAELLEKADTPVLKLAPFGTLISILSRCGAYIGNDSGVTHLAANASAKTVAFFGPTDPRVWAPLGEKVKIVSMDSANIEEVLLQLKEY